MLPAIAGIASQRALTAICLRNCCVYCHRHVSNRDPRHRSIHASHAFDLAATESRRVRRLVESDEYRALFPSVQLRADPENHASCRVAEKAGFTLEGVLRSAHWNARLGRRQDWALYSLLPGELE